MKINCTIAALLVIIPAVLLGQRVKKGESDPNKVQIITTDIPRFWAAFDSCKADPKNSVAIFNKLYFEPGTMGLKKLDEVDIKGTENLVLAVEKYHAYYESVRPRTLRIITLEPEIRKYLTRFKELYPKAQFPPIYFLIGKLNAGGKSEKEGLLIGAELVCADSTSDMENIIPSFQKLLKANDFSKTPGTVIHELVHYQQSYGDTTHENTLLAYAVREGSADFIAGLIVGENKTKPAFNYGEQHEKELWGHFRADMDGFDINKWMYNVGTVEKPSDLGYYVGYKIVKAYYMGCSNKKQAIDDLLNIKDFHAFLKQSGYGDKFK